MTVFASGYLVDLPNRDVRVDAHGNEWGNGWEFCFSNGIVVQVPYDVRLWDSDNPEDWSACGEAARLQAITQYVELAPNYGLSASREIPIVMEEPWMEVEQNSDAGTIKRVVRHRRPIVFMYEVQETSSSIIYRFRGKHGLDRWHHDFTLASVYRDEHLAPLHKQVKTKLEATLSERLFDLTQLCLAEAPPPKPVMEFRGPKEMARLAEHNQGLERRSKHGPRLPVTFDESQVGALARESNAKPDLTAAYHNDLQRARNMGLPFSAVPVPPGITKIVDPVEQRRAELEQADRKERVMGYIMGLCEALHISAPEFAAAFDVSLGEDHQLIIRTHDGFTAARGDIKPKNEYEQPPIDLRKGGDYEHPPEAPYPVGHLELD